MNDLRTIDAATYYADLCGGEDAPPTLSQSMAHTLIDKSPLHAWMWHPRLGGGSKPVTKAMDRGTLLHSLLLNTAVDVEILPFDSYRSKAAQEDRDSAILAGKLPVLSAEFDQCLKIAEAVRKQVADFGLSLEGQSEGVVLWTETADDGTPVNCRARVDLWDRCGTIYDLKTTGDARLSKCVRSIIDHGGDIQAASNTLGVESHLPDMAGRVRFVNIFIETEAPHLITPIRQDGSFLAMGRAKWRRAINLVAKCRRENRWPGYATATLSASAPAWALTNELQESPSDESLSSFA